MQKSIRELIRYELCFVLLRAISWIVEHLTKEPIHESHETARKPLYGYGAATLMMPRLLNGPRKLTFNHKSLGAPTTLSGNLTTT